MTKTEALELAEQMAWTTTRFELGKLPPIGSQESDAWIQRRDELRNEIYSEIKDAGLITNDP